MKITIITSFAFPYGKATANRIIVFAEELLRNPKVTNIEIFCVSNNKSRSYSVNESLQITSLKVTKFNKNNLLIRAVYEILISFKLFILARKSECAVTIVTIPSFLLLLPLILFPKKTLISLDVRDAVWTYMNGKYYYKIIRKMAAILFRYAAKRSDVISVTNKAEYEKVREISGCFPIIVANGISRTKLEEMSKISMPDTSDVMRLSYIGNVGIAQELEKFLDFTKSIPELRVKIVGDGAKLETLKLKCINESMENVTFTGFVEPTTVAEYIEGSDILFAQIGVDFCTAIPTKVFEYIASGRKVLLGLPKGPAREVFSKFYGVEIFDVGVFESFLNSYGRLKNLLYTERDREKNISILKEQHLRETSARALMESIFE